MRLDLNKAQAAVDHAHLAARENLWYVLGDLVDYAPRDVAGVRVTLRSEVGDEAGADLGAEAFGDAASGLLGAAIAAATLPERAAFLALAGTGSTDLRVEPADLLAPDGRPVVDEGERLGVEAGLVVTASHGADVLDREGLRSGFREARARILDACPAAAVNPLAVERFTVICGPDLELALRRALDEGDGPARLLGSLVRLWASPRLIGEERWHVVAHAPRGIDKPFAWRTDQRPTVTGPRLTVTASGTLEVRAPWCVATVQPSGLVVAGADLSFAGAA